jgi:hypothetical protein
MTVDEATLVVLIVIAVELGILAWMIRWAIRLVSTPVLDYQLPMSLPWPQVKAGDIETAIEIPDPMQNKSMGDHMMYAMCAMKTYLTMHQQRPMSPMSSPATPPPPGPPSP